MRKRTISHLFDKAFWYLLYLLPLILIAFTFYRTGNLVNLSTCLEQMGLNIITTNPIYTTLIDVFGVSGVLPLFSQPVIFEILTYFISVFLLHMAVDFLLFIPRIAMYWLDKFYGGNDD